MHYFCTVAEQGQISRAARVLNIAQPPLSQRMYELEEELGCTLFVRGARSLSLTPAGELFHKRAREILRAVEAARDDVVRLSLPSGPAIRVGLSPTCRNHWLRHFTAYQSRLKDRQIGLVVGDSSYLEYLLQTGQLDIALMQPPLHPENFTIREQFRCPTVAVAPRALFKPGIEKLTLEELSHHPLLLLRRSVGIGSYEHLMHHLRNAGLPAEVALYSSDVAILLDLLPQIPNSLAIVPATETEALPEAYGILSLDFELPDHQFSFVCLATPEGHALLDQISTSGNTGQA
jgi:DNA-binding transcriptional LysR family regulator